MKWQRLDARNWATAHPMLTVAVFAVATGVMLYGNIITQRGGVLDDPILDLKNPYRQSDLYVRSKRADGFQGQESILFLLQFPGGIRSADDLLRLRSFTERVKDAFGPAVLSLSEVDDYEDTGDALLRDPYIPARFPADFDVKKWKRRVAANPTVFGTLIGRHFKWAAVVRHLTPGYEDIVEYRRTVEFLEGRHVPWWEWLYKTDIKAPEGVGVAGGVIVIGLLEQGLKVDNVILVGVGVALAFPLFVWCLGSVRQALIGVLGVVALGFLWTRGSIGLLQLLGFEFKERLYTLLAYTNCIVQGVSFVLHKFEAFNEVMREKDCPPDSRAHWDRARGNDPLIGVTALIAIFGFATLYSFQVVSVRELGIFSAISVIWLFFLITVFVPALHIIISRGEQRRIESQQPPGAAGFRRAFELVVAGCTVLVTRFAPRRTALVAGCSTIALVLLGIGLIWPGNLMVVKMIPLKFVKGTVVERTAKFLDVSGRMGHDVELFLVEPAGGGDIYDPAFVAALWKYQEQLKQDPRFREVVSVVNYVRYLSLESLQKPLPATRQEAAAMFNLIEGDLNTAITRQLFYRGGVRMTVHFVGKDSVASGELLDYAVQVARRDHPQLRVSSFGKESLYPQFDRYIRLGKPINVFGSQWVVVVICWIGLWLNNRRRLVCRERGLKLSPPVGGFFMSLPFLFASAVIAIVMIGLAVPLDAGTASIAALAINASVDFAIYYADAYQAGLAAYGSHIPAVRWAMERKGRIVLEDMLLNSICFLPLLASRFEPIRDVGWIMVVMLAACAFGTVVIMPALFYAGLRPEVAPLGLTGAASGGRAAAEAVARVPLCELAPDAECAGDDPKPST